MTISDDLITAIQHILAVNTLDIRQLPLDDMLLTVPVDKLVEVSKLLVDGFGFYHLSTITGIDTGSGIELLYHFWNKTGLTLRLVLPYETLQVDTLTELIPGAQFYEQEIAEMLGISIIGLTGAPLLLPDDWDSTPPLLQGEL